MRTVFIVDDESEMRRKYKKLLKGEGFSVIVAPNALEVANILMRDKSRIDLILLDINIPDIDGHDISDIITEYSPELPIMVNSVLPISEQKIRIRNAVDYCSKLDGEEVFLKKVKKILGV